MKNTFVTAQEASITLQKLGKLIPEMPYRPTSNTQKIIEFFNIQENWEVLIPTAIFLGIFIGILKIAIT